MQLFTRLIAYASGAFVTKGESPDAFGLNRRIQRQFLTQKARNTGLRAKWQWIPFEIKASGYPDRLRIRADRQVGTQALHTVFPA
mgnify:CR=1 FL=1